MALSAAVSLGMIVTQASALNNRQQVIPAEARKAQPPSSAHVPLIDHGLHLSDFAGMEPRPELKGKLQKISGFIQNSPHDGEPGTEDTVVWLGYTKTDLYLVFICHDRHPEEIRGHLARRENILNDDNVTVILDPFHDHRLGVVFKVNPAGVQADAAWNDLVGADYSYDQVWDSEGQVTHDGWMALMAIPFRSLRFRSDGSDWGVVFQRSLPRNSETDFWPRVAVTAFGYLSQEGTLSGIEGVAGSHNLQVNPYVLGQNERTLENLDPLNPYFSSRHMEGTAGGEVKAVVKDSIVVDATVNPDFSDIESEQPQFTVDQRYAVYFPELRPFFLENANYFTTPIQLLYTRNIVHPEYGIRTTGKIGDMNIGLIAIDDRAPGEMVAPGDPLYQKHATFAVGRISKNIGKGSSIGAMYTDEEFGHGWSRIGGVDFTALMNKNWTLQGQWVESSTKVNIDSTTTPSYSAGPASNIRLHRSGRSFSLDTTLLDYSSGFQSQVGFIPITNIRNGTGHSFYKWFPKHGVIQNYGPETNQNIAFDHLGNRVFHYSSFDFFVTLPRNTVIAPLGGQNSDTLGHQNNSLLTHNVNFTENFGGITARSAPSPKFNFNLTALRGGNVNYNPVACPTPCAIKPNNLPSLMNQENAQVLFTLQPLRRLTVDNTYLLDRDHSVSDGALVYESQTFRTKINYQFTQAFSARAIVEYDSTLANSAETSLLRTKEVGTEALLTWLPHPGTAIYLGYNDDLQNLDRSLCNRLPNDSCDPSNTTAPRSTQFLNDGRQIFFKASYLFRF
jgi:hypothetical protein